MIVQNKGRLPVSPRSQQIKQSGLFGFLAQPDAPTKSGVVILPTIFGVNSFVRDYAETLARAGLAAAVWDHYEGLPLTTDYEESKARARKLSDAGMHAAAGKWIDYMLGDLQLTSVGVLGFCLGGRYVLMAAARDQRIKTCAAVYPSIDMPRHPNQEQDALAIAADIGCPVHVVQPGHDHVASPETYATLKQTLLKRPAPTIWQYYPDAEHGFMHRNAPPANPAASAIASPQLVGFLAGCLL
jgi:carboxymethylenebutenolidase